MKILRRLRAVGRQLGKNWRVVYPGISSGMFIIVEDQLFHNL